MNRFVFDPKYQVYCGEHFDVEAAAVEQARRDYLWQNFAVTPATADPAQCAAADAWAMDETNWNETLPGVIPLHKCGEAEGGHAAPLPTARPATG